MGAGKTGERGPRPRLLADSMVGREDVLSRVDRMLERDAGSPPVIQVVGEAGIGKSRLVRAIAERARADGRLVLEGRARSGDAALPFAVFQDALRARRRAAGPAPADDPVSADFATHLLPELGGRPDAPAASRAALLEAAARDVAALARPSGLVLVLEDLHWADPSSNTLVLYLAQTLGAEPLTLVVTIPPGRRRARLEPGPPAGANSVVSASAIILGRLDPAAVEAMLADILGVVPDERARAAIVGMSGGVPFVVEEVVRNAVDADRLDAERGTWRGDLALHPPASVRALLLARAEG